MSFFWTLLHLRMFLSYWCIFVCLFSCMDITKFYFSNTYWLKISNICWLDLLIFLQALQNVSAWTDWLRGQSSLWPSFLLVSVYSENNTLNNVTKHVGNWLLFFLDIQQAAVVCVQWSLFDDLSYATLLCVLSFYFSCVTSSFLCSSLFHQGPFIGI